MKMQDMQINQETAKKRTGGGTRIAYIDALKGFLMVCVVLGHVAIGYIEGNIYPQANQSYFSIMNVIYAFHMPLFMMVSGYLYANAYYEKDGMPKRKRIYRQFGNIVVVYVLFSVAYGLSKIIFQDFTVNKMPWTDILYIWGIPIKVYWYLYDLGIYYLLFSIPSISKADHRYMLCALVIVAIVGSCSNILWFDASRLLYSALFFYIGILGKMKPNLIIGNKKLTAVALVISITLIIIFWDREPFQSMDSAMSLNHIPVANAVIALGISLFVWCLFQDVTWLSTSRIFPWIGRYSLEIYVIHGVISPAFRALVSNIRWIGPWVSVIINCALCIALPMAFSWVCKKIGVHELIFKPISAILRMKENRQKA